MHTYAQIIHAMYPDKEHLKAACYHRAICVDTLGRMTIWHFADKSRIQEDGNGSFIVMG
jgi:hypothetical protein